MQQELLSSVNQLLGVDVDPQDLTVSQMAGRALVVFTATLIMLRLAHNRFFARRNTLDLVFAVIIASVLSRAINGSAALFPTITTGFGFIFLHRALAWVSSRSEWLGRLVKSGPSLLVENGEADLAALRRHNITLDDLMEDLRLAGVAGIDQVRLATLERNGEISVVTTDSDRRDDA